MGVVSHVQSREGPSGTGRECKALEWGASQRLVTGHEGEGGPTAGLGTALQKGASEGV